MQTSSHQSPAARIGAVFLQDPTIHVNALVDTGATQSLINHRFLKENDFMNKYPRYDVPPKPIVIGDGSSIEVKEAIKFTVELEGHMYEINALIFEAEKDKLDLVIGAKSLLKLQANVKFSTLAMELPITSLQVTSQESQRIPAGEHREVVYTIRDPPPKFSPGIAIIKGFTLQPDRLL